MNDINLSVRRLEAEILRKRKIILRIQQNCKHDNFTRKKIKVQVSGSELDFYENHCHCPTCHKFWKEESTY